MERELNMDIETAIPAALLRLIKIKHQGELCVVNSQNELIALTKLSGEYVLGKGDTAIVLTAESDDSDEPVALKIYTSPDIKDPNRLRQLVSDEAMLLRDIIHPNIVKFLGMGTVKITDNLILPVSIREQVSTSLEGVYSKSQNLTIEETINMVRSISSGLEYLYVLKGMVMTDITPGNIGQREDKTWAIIDLGHMALQGSEREVGVDERFTAPEILIERDVKKQNNIATPQSEVYSLALIAWKSLTGKDINVVTKSMNPDNLITQENIPTAIFQVLQKAASADPEKRYTNPTAFVKALEDASPSISTPEKETSEVLRNLSGLPEWQVRQQVEDVLQYAERMVVFPDLGPTEKGIVPTGSATEVDILKHPDWLRLVNGADIGCGMVMAKLNSHITEAEFLKDQKNLDRLRDELKNDAAISLGGGNHFIDFVVNENDGSLSVVIHTGAYRDMQKKLTAIVDQAKKDNNWAEATRKYMEEYQKVILSATANREAILKKITKIYGNCETSFHEAHNTIDINKENHTATIYKGVVHVTDKSKRILLPSSMEGSMIFYLPGEAVGPNSLYGAPHGTGRAVSRGDMKTMEAPAEKPKIMIPTGASIPTTELPHAYRKSARAKEIMSKNGIMGNKPDQQFRPIAYLGHI